jgi:adenylate cyclase 5
VQVEAICDFALEMFAVLARVNADCFTNFELQIGINVGPVVGGVIGTRKFTFDIWGDAVNVASRMVSVGWGDRDFLSASLD